MRLDAVPPSETEAMLVCAGLLRRTVSNVEVHDGGLIVPIASPMGLRALRVIVAGRVAQCRDRAVHEACQSLAAAGVLAPILAGYPGVTWTECLGLMTSAVPLEELVKRVARLRLAAMEILQQGFQRSPRGAAPYKETT